MKSFVLTLQRFVALRGMCAGIGIGVAALLFSAPSHAATFNFDFEQVSGTASIIGVFTADGSSGNYTITGLTGAYNTIYHMTLMPVDYSLFHNDNSLFYPSTPYLSTNGFAFWTESNTAPWHLYGLSSGGYWVTNSNNLFDGASFTGTITQIAAATPLPAALPLFATGLGALGLLGWRRKRKAQATA